MANVAAAAKMNKVLSELQMKGDLFTRQMVMEKKRVDDLEEAIRQADDQIKKFRLKNKSGAVEVLNLNRFTANPAHQRADGADPSKQAEINQQKLVANLENRLNKILVRQSQSENHNRNLKAQIDSHRRKRMAANNVAKQLQENLKEMQVKCQEVMDRSCAASEVREKAVEQQNQLVADNCSESIKFAEDVDKLAQYIAAQNERFEKSISEAANAVKADAGFEAANSDDNVRGDLSIEEETHLGELVRDLAKQVEVERESLHATEERIAVYRKSFDELKSVSGHSELTDVVQVYVKSEEETFSLFNYIQALNQETDWTLERHARLEEEIKKYEERLGEEEAQRAEAMADLQEKWRNAKEATEECSQAALEAQRTLDRIAKKIQSLFFKIQCDQVTDKGKPSKGGGGAGGAAGKGSADSRLAALGGQGVSESNILAYTELIEQRALEIIADYTKRMNAHEQRQMTPMLDVSKSLLSNLPGAPANDQVKPPDVPGDDEENDDENDDKWPISLEEMRRRTAEKLLKKQNSRPAAASNPHAHKKKEASVKFKGGHGRKDTTH